MVTYRRWLFVCITAATLLWVACAQNNVTNPYDCSKTKGNLFVKSPNNSQFSSIEISDTIGNTISYGFNSNLFINVDSVQIVQISSSNPSGTPLPPLKDISSRKNSDTVWNSLLLSDTGKIALKGTAYLHCNANLSVTITITVFSRPPNHPPTLKIPHLINIRPGDICTLAVLANDPDTSQTLTFSAITTPTTGTFNPQTRIFIWKAPANLTGVDSAVFKVKDNGYPPLSDQKTVHFNVQTAFVNNKPIISVHGIRNIHPGAICTLMVDATDIDSLQTVAISMMSGPKGALLKDSLFTWIAPANFFGVDSAVFIAQDDGTPPLSDTAKVYINVTNNIPLPSRPDSLKIASRTAGWALLNWHSSNSADYYTVFRSTMQHGATFIPIDTVFDTLCKDFVGSLNCQYYVQAYNKTGESPSSDTVVSLYINPAPKWQYDTVNEVIAVGQSLTLTLSTMCSDANGGPITYSLIAGKPDNDTIKSGVYTFIPAMSDTGVWGPRIIAKDPQGLADTLYIHLTVTATASINHKPVLSVSGVRTIKTGSICTLTATATDLDSNQTHTFSVIKQPAGSTFNPSTGTFSLTTSAALKGIDTVIFMVVDNGVPPMSDTQIVQITVSDSVINHPPKWQSDTITLSAIVGNALTLTLADKCIDPDGDKVFFSLLSGKPAGDTVKAGLYSFTPTASDTGVFSLNIVAKDTFGLADTLLLRLTVSAGDRQAPYLKLIAPVSDSTTVGTSSLTVKVLCKDPSGVASLKCSMGADTFAVSNIDTIYSALVSGLKSTGVNEILFIATDKSANANRDTLKVHIKYVPPPVDSLGPIITLVTPAKDSAITNSSNYAVTVKCTDASGVLSVNGALGTTISTGVRDTGSIWKISISGLVANALNTIILTAIDSSQRANKTMDTLYIKSDIVTPFTITFDKNDASATGTMAAQTINSGASAPLTVNTFTKAGYTFAGWMISATGTTVAYADQAVYIMGTANVTLYAKWTAIPTYSLTYDGNGSTGGTAPATVTGKVSGSIVTVAANSFTRANYTFSAWNTKSDGSGDSYAPASNITITANTTLYAIWTPTYSLTYNGNNNTGGTAPSTVSGLLSGSVVTVAANSFTRTNYTFSVWNTQSNGSGTSYAPGANISITSNTTLYAQWTINTYVVHFDKNDNAATGSMLTQSIQSGSSAALLPVGFSKPCFDFAGWATSASGAVVYQNQGSITMGSGDINLYAKWTAKAALTFPALQNVDWYCGGPNIVSYSVQVTGAIGNPSYTWWYDSAGTSKQCSTAGGDFHGYSSATLTMYPPISINSTSFWCVVTDNCNSKETNHATFHQHPVASLPDFINGTCYSPIDVSFPVDCGGSYKWYESLDGTYTGGQAIADMDPSLIALLTYSGYTTSTLHIGQLDSENDFYYFCEVTAFGETVRSNICKVSGPNGTVCP